MAGWTEAPAGTWTLTPTIVVDAATYLRYEQIRKSVNFLYFTTVTEMSDEDFAAFLIEGKVSDRSEPELNGRQIPAQYSFNRMWIEFKKFWVDRKTRVIDSADDGDTEALAVVVPAPPAP